jgi:hypothetical protein
MPKLKWTWYDGGRDKPAWIDKKLRELAHGLPIPDSGSLIIDDKGALFSPNDYGASYVLLPKAEFDGYQKPSPTLPRSPGHRQEWIQAIRENRPDLPMSNFSYAGPLTETVLLGVIASHFADQKLDWNSEKLEFTNFPEANAYVRQPYRKGWEVEGL